MLVSSIPTKIPTPFANSAVPPYTRAVPIPSQIGIQAGAASFTDGFPPVNFLSVGAGGTPPWGADLNGLLNQMTKWLRWNMAGAPVAWDSAFSTAIGGYPAGAVVASAVTLGTSFVSMVDNNTTNPDAGGANWSPISTLGTFTTGDVKLTYKTVADSGWVMITDGQIGSATSGATYANANAAALYAVMWNNVSNTFAPVSGGRGANAAADFAANKSLSMPRILGRALAIAGAGAGLTSRPIGQTLGEETHLMTLGELVTHTHATTPASPTVGTGPGDSVQRGSADTPVPTNHVSFSNSNTGSSTPFNIMQPSAFINCMIKL